MATASVRQASALPSWSGDSRSVALLNRKFTSFGHGSRNRGRPPGIEGESSLAASKTVVAFVGENENEVLAAGSRELLASIERQGFEGHVIDLHDPQWTTEL